jgi:hypothetical protein
VGAFFKFADARSISDSDDSFGGGGGAIFDVQPKKEAPRTANKQSDIELFFFISLIVS